MRHASVERVYRVTSCGQRDFSVQGQPSRSSQIYLDAVSLKNRSDDSGSGLERRPLVRARDSLNEPSKATSPVAAHVGDAPIAVIAVPRSISFPCSRRNHHKKTIRANATLAMPKGRRFPGPDADLPIPVINQDEVIPRAVHFGELQL